MEDFEASVREPRETSDSEGDDARSCGESENLSDIDDAEICSYLHNEEEKHLKKIAWEKLNQEYLQEREAKKTAAASNTAKPKKGDRQKRTTGVKKTQVADPASSKRCSARINYDALSKILDEPDEPLPSESSKRRKIASEYNQKSGKDFTEAQLANDELSVASENEEENDWDDPQDYSDYANQEEEYNPYNDDEFY